LRLELSQLKEAEAIAKDNSDLVVNLNELLSLKTQHNSLSQLLQEAHYSLQSLSKENTTLRAYQTNAMLAEEEAKKNITILINSSRICNWISQTSWKTERSFEKKF